VQGDESLSFAVLSDRSPDGPHGAGQLVAHASHIQDEGARWFFVDYGPVESTDHRKCRRSGDEIGALLKAPPHPTQLSSAPWAIQARTLFTIGRSEPVAYSSSLAGMASPHSLPQKEIVRWGLSASQANA